MASTVEDLLSLKRRSWRIPYGRRGLRPLCRGSAAPDRHRRGRDPVLRPNSRFPVGGGRPVSEDLTLSDGTALEVWATGTQENQYRLSDGTVLLRSSRPKLDFSNDYVGEYPAQ